VDGSDLSHLASDNVIQGNFIGTDVTGTQALGNGLGPVSENFGFFGISTAFASHTTIGGTAAGTGNLISANNSDQIHLDADTGNVIQGNKIGTDVTGTKVLGTGLTGIAIGFNAASVDNTIGGTAPGAANTIAFFSREIFIGSIIMVPYGGFGVFVGSASNGNRISGNSIFGNLRRGIALFPNANNAQKAPTLTAANTSGGGTFIQGTLTSTPNATFTIEFFASPTQTTTPQTFLGSVTTTSDATGTAPIAFTSATPVPAGQFITATATDAANDTSEFAVPIAVTSTVTPPQAAGFRIDAPATATAGVPFTVTVTALDAGNNVLTGYTGTVHFATTSPKFSLPADYTFTTGDNGVHTFTNAVSLNTAGSRLVGISDTATGVSGQSAAISVAPNVATHLLVKVPTPAQEAIPQDVTVTALDAFENTATGYTGTIHFTSPDTLQLQADYPFTSGAGADNGVHAFKGGVIFGHLGSVTVTATDRDTAAVTGSATGATGPGPADHFALSAPATVQPGKAFTFTVTAQDALNTTATGYNNAVSFSSSDPAAQLTLIPGGATFLTNGQRTFTEGISLRTLGSQTLTASDFGNSSITGSTTLTVAGTLFRPTSVSGLVFEDFDGDGVFQDSEAIQGEGPTVFLDVNNNGRLDPGEPSYVALGSAYSFQNAPVGTYAVREVLFPGTLPTTPTATLTVTDAGATLTGGGSASVTMTDTGTSITGLNFGNVFTSSIVPLTASATIFPPSPDLDTAYVRGLYHSILGRDVEAFGLGFWLAQLHAAGGTRQAVAQGIWESVEHRTQEAVSYYASFLHRTPAPAELQKWVDALLGGAGEANAVLTFVTSPEYLQLHPIVMPYGQALSQDVSGDPNHQVLANLGDPPSAATAYILDAKQKIVDSYYAVFLHRRPSVSEEQGWLQSLQGVPATQLPLEAIAVNILTSPEYVAAAAASVST
jgi:parallel beta-helix repeat protein